MSLIARLSSALGHRLGTERAGGPFRLVVEISNVCNLRCAMCPRRFMRRPQRFMEPEAFEALLAAAGDGLEFVALNGYGEPLLHPQLPRLLDACRARGVGTGISTNCTRLTEAMARTLLDHPPDQLTLAVDGVEAAGYESVRVGASFAAVVENVRRFLRMKGDGPPFTVLQCIQMTETKDAVPRFGELFAGLPFDAVRIRQLTFSGRERSDDAYANSRKSCFWLWNEPMVLSDGRLTVCCQDVNGDLALGQASDGLATLWNGSRARHLRKLHATGRRQDIPACRDCNMYQPHPVLALGAALCPTALVGRLVPKAETLLSRLRYGQGRRP